MTRDVSVPLTACLQRIAQCQQCASCLPHPPRPVVQASSQAKLLIIGQAPGRKVHHSGIPWHDASGVRLRQWMGIDEGIFYDPQQVAIVPMGLCYPGQATSGDKPPAKVCAPLWHPKLLPLLPNIQLTLLIGQYAQRYYLNDKPPTLTDTVQQWSRWLPQYFVLPHPSPRNQIWLKKNPWFDTDLLPHLKAQVQQVLG